MDCLSQKQIAEYLAGNKSEETELHFVQCRDCRTRLMKARADDNVQFAISKKLAQTTIKKIVMESTGENDALSADSRVRRFPKRYVFACAAVLLLFIFGLAYFAKTIQPTRTPEVATTLPDHPAAALVKTDVDSGCLSQVMKVWLDTIRVKDGAEVGKKVVDHEKGTTIRLGGKSGIVAEPMTVLHLSDRTDTTAVITLRLKKNDFVYFALKHPRPSSESRALFFPFMPTA
jgi:hypothetical protein